MDQNAQAQGSTGANENRTIELTADQAAVLTREINDGVFAMGWLLELMKRKDRLTESDARTCLDAVQRHLREMGKTLGLETEAARVIEERYAKLRAANLRIRELETQMGQSITPGMAQAALRDLSEKLYDWWRLEGFGHISKVTFETYGVRAQLCCMLFGPSRGIRSATPVSDKETQAKWLESLGQRGLQLVTPPRERTPSVLDNDHNRALLTALIRERMPSAVVDSFVNRVEGEDIRVLVDVEVLIRRFEDIQGLPGEPK